MGKLSPPVGMGAVGPALSALDSLRAARSPGARGSGVSGYLFGLPTVICAALRSRAVVLDWALVLRQALQRCFPGSVCFGGGFVSYTFKGRTDSIVSRSFADLKSDQGEMHVKLHPWVSSVPCPEILQGHSG